MKKTFEALGCSLIAIGGMPDHVHCLFKLNKQKPVAEVIKKVKGTSSRYINDNEITPDYFGWQVGYGAFSVSKENIISVKKYIEKQKWHHANITFEHELAVINKQPGI